MGFDPKYHHPLFQRESAADVRERELAWEREQAKRAADAEAHHALADLHMPDDLRESAKRWGVEQLMQAVWMNAWESGFRFAMKRKEPSDV